MLADHVRCTDPHFHVGRAGRRHDARSVRPDERSRKVTLMSDANTQEGPVSTEEEEEDWTEFADAGYGSAYDPWSDLVQHEPEESEHEQFEDDEHWEVSPAPSAAGIAHLVRIGSCDHCLTRLSGGRLAWSSAAEDGAAIRARTLEVESSLSIDESVDCCPFCEDLFADLDLLVTRTVDKLAGVEFTRVQLGSHFAKDHIAEEEELRTRHGAQGSRGLKAGFVEAFADRLRVEYPSVKVVKERPQVMLLVDTLTLEVKVDIRSLYLYGRYRKLERGIPQTRWPCRACRGRGGGCESCAGSGLQYPDSVQDLIGEPLRRLFGAADTSFHGMGREDIDVRCLGSGRPFVIELKSPLKRTADHSELIELVNDEAGGRVEVLDLRASKRPEVARIKQTAAEKSYTICFSYEGDLDADEVERQVLSLAGETLYQQTPNRVSHRRADKVRERKVVSITNVVVEPPEVQLCVRAESGTYVKELIHSDEGRTTPSITERLGVPCEVLWLDVEEVHAD